MRLSRAVTRFAVHVKGLLRDARMGGLFELRDLSPMTGSAPVFSDISLFGWLRHQTRRDDWRPIGTWLPLCCHRNRCGDGKRGCRGIHQILSVRMMAHPPTIVCQVSCIVQPLNQTGRHILPIHAAGGWHDELSMRLTIRASSAARYKHRQRRARSPAAKLPARALCRNDFSSIWWSGERISCPAPKIPHSELRIVQFPTKLTTPSGMARA
jgi:hypothetical protein